MTLKKLAAASCLSMATATSTFAAPITLDFAFGAVTGTFYGLDDADGTSRAERFDLNYGGSSWTNVSAVDASWHRFTFSSGALSEVEFWNRINIDADDDSYYIREFIIEDGYGIITLPGFPYNPAFAPDGDVTFTINPVAAVPLPVAAVPLPAGGLLLLTAFGGVAALKRRKKRAA